MTLYANWPDLASPRLGGAVLWANDEFFGPKEDLLREEDPIYEPGRYTPRGKWMDGWETRRRRAPRGEPLGHDACLIRLGLAGIVRRVLVDTRHFRGNFAPEFSLDAASLRSRDGVGSVVLDELLDPGLAWSPLIPRSPLAGDELQSFELDPGAALPSPTTHVRFCIYPDGGVARLRLHGEVMPDLARLRHIARGGGEVDLAALVHGGRPVAVSDAFFSRPYHMLLPGPPLGMYDGWETRRRRGPGNDWVVVRLGVPGLVERIEVDTTFFRGNAPRSCSVEATAEDPLPDEPAWTELLPETDLQPHTRHLFERRDGIADPETVGPVRHIRLSIYPDGGVARLRVQGVPA